MVLDGFGEFKPKEDYWKDLSKKKLKSAMT
jgi:hypothetical protein